jgi:hypothetical protein
VYDNGNYNVAIYPACSQFYMMLRSFHCTKRFERRPRIWEDPESGNEYESGQLSGHFFFMAEQSNRQYAWLPWGSSPVASTQRSQRHSHAPHNHSEPSRYSEVARTLSCRMINPEGLEVLRNTVCLETQGTIKKHFS